MAEVKLKCSSCGQMVVHPCTISRPPKNDLERFAIDGDGNVTFRFYDPMRCERMKVPDVVSV